MPYCEDSMVTKKDISKASSFLDHSNASSEGIEEKWAASNEQWWDWYLSLAQNRDEDAGPEISLDPLPSLSPGENVSYDKGIR